MKNFNKEEWKEYKNSGYFFSNYGEIKKKLKNGRWRYLSNSHTDRYGYPNTTIVVDGKNKTVSFHRVVAELFIPNPENKPQVNHINGDKTNNRVSNLEWATPQENMEHCFKKLHNKVTKPVIRVSKDLKEFKWYASLADAARANGADRKNISRAAETFYSGGEMKTIKGYYWHFVN